MNEESPLSDEFLGQVLRAYRAQPTELQQELFWSELEARLDTAPQGNDGKIIWLRSPWFAAAAVFAVVLISFPMLQNLSLQKSKVNNTGTYEQVDAQHIQLKDESAAKKPMRLGAAAPSVQNEPSLENKVSTEASARRLPQGQTAGLGPQEFDKSRYSIPAGLVHVLQPFSVTLQSPSANVFDISLPDSEHLHFEAALKQWAVAHNLEQMNVVSGRVYYRLTLRTN